MTMMMMMIVDLYSVLCRAPLLHYVTRCIVKRNVLYVLTKIILSEIISLSGVPFFGLLGIFCEDEAAAVLAVTIK